MAGRDQEEFGSIFLLSLVAFLHFVAFMAEWAIFIVILRNTALQTTGRFLACNYFLADIWKLFITVFFHSDFVSPNKLGITASEASNSGEGLWVLQLMAPIFAYLALPILLINCLSFIKNPQVYPFFERNLMKFGLVFVWLLGVGWCGILTSSHLLELKNPSPFRHFLFIIHTFSVLFALFLLVDIGLHKWQSRRRVWNQHGLSTFPPPIMTSPAPTNVLTITTPPPTIPISTNNLSPTTSNTQPISAHFLSNRIDCVTITSGSRVLIANQSNPAPPNGANNIVQPGVVQKNTTIPFILLVLSSAVIIVWPLETLKTAGVCGNACQIMITILNPICSILGVALFVVSQKDVFQSFVGRSIGNFS